MSLVLTRKKTEEIHFPALGIVVRVLKTSNGSVKLGVDAPENIRILRGELVGQTPPDDSGTEADEKLPEGDHVSDSRTSRKAA